MINVLVGIQLSGYALGFIGIYFHNGNLTQLGGVLIAASLFGGLVHAVAKAEKE